MKVAIIGSRRNISGIGQYIARYFHQNGATVTAVLGTTAESASAAAAALQQYGIDAAAHTDFTGMAEGRAFDTVAIASPTATHYGYLIKSLQAGAHIFCEKPFVFTENNALGNMLENIFTLAATKNLTIAMNSQWPFSLPFYEDLCGSIDPGKADRFFMRLSPSCSGREMIIEALPHALSILYCTLGAGKLIPSDVQHDLHGEKLFINGTYHSQHARLTVQIELIRSTLPPRELAFGFNDMIVERRLHLDSYAIFFKRGGEITKIVDPLDLSVRDFMAAVSEKREPLIGKSHIMSTTVLLRNLYASCTMS